MQLSKRAREIQASPIRKLMPHAVAAKKRGTKVYPLNLLKNPTTEVRRREKKT